MKKFPYFLTAFFLVVLLTVSISPAFAAEDKLPTRDNPLIVDKEGKRVLIYTEVNEKGLHETNPHWGVVSKDGEYGDKAILKAYVNHLAFHDALLEIGAKPGNNLTKDVLNVPVQGDLLELTATWPGLGKELKVDDIFYDESGKGFAIRFGGNRKAAEGNHTGCLTCLESCWVAITSNAEYPNISPAKRFIIPNSRFKGREDVLPGGDKPVILIYRLVGS